MVHDPLRLDATPWELLALPPDLTAKSDREYRTLLDRAFTQALKNRVPPQKAKAARDTLLRPAGRARIALLSYPPADFARLAGERGSLVLEPGPRAATAQAWQARFALALDDLPAAHCLLALWWNWAHYEEARVRDRKVPALAVTPDRFALWSAVIAYLGLFAAERAYVAERFGLAPEAATELLDDLVEELKAGLLDRAQALGGGVEAKRYRLLERFLVEEVRAARVFGAARVAYGGVERALGPRLLARLGLTEKAESARREAAARAEGPVATLALKVSLNPYGALEALAREGKPEQALDALEILPPEERSSAEAERARAAVLTVQAFHQVKAGKLEQALTIWGRAAPGSLAWETEAEILRLVTARVDELARGRRDRQVMELLVLAVKVLPGSEALRALASSERSNSALRTLTGIRERVERNKMQLNDMRLLHEKIDELEPAHALGVEGVGPLLDWARVAVETHTIGGLVNRDARAKLEVELGRWRDRSRQVELRSALKKLLEEFRSAARHFSRLARANVDLVERRLERLDARERPGEMPALVRAELVRLDEARGAAGPALEDLAELEDLLFDLEPAAVGSPEALALTTQLKKMIAALLKKRAHGVLAGLSEPLRGPGGLRLVTATRELKALLAVNEDLRRALALTREPPAPDDPLADVAAALERAGAKKQAEAPAPPGRADRLLRVPLAVLLVIAALVILLFWLLKSVAKGLRTVHR